MTGEAGKLGRYTLLGMISDGTTAEIFRAQEGDNAVAIKHFRKTENVAYDTRFWQAFHKISRSCAKLSHRALVRPLAFGKHAARPFVVFEYVEGQSLEQALRHLAQAHRTLPTALAVYVASEIASALRHAHQLHDAARGTTQTILHRRVNPEKILITNDGHCKLADFGVAALLDAADRSPTSQPRSSPGYLAPEALLGEALKPGSDLFSLGVVLWELLTGQVLFHGTDTTSVQNMVLTADFQVLAPSTIQMQIPPALDAIVARALSRDREKRFENALEMREALGNVLKKLGKTPRQCAQELSLILQQMRASSVPREIALTSSCSIELDFDDFRGNSARPLPTPKSSPHPTPSEEKTIELSLLHSPERESDPSMERTKDLGMVSRPSTFETPRSFSPKDLSNDLDNLNDEDLLDLVDMSPWKIWVGAAIVAAIMALTPSISTSEGSKLPSGSQPVAAVGEVPPPLPVLQLPNTPQRRWRVPASRSRHR